MIEAPNNEVTHTRGRDLLVAIVSFVFPTLVTLVYFVLLDEGPTAAKQSAYGIGKTLQFGFPLVWVLLVLRRDLPWRKRLQLGWPTRQGMVAGFFFGAIVASLMWLIYRHLIPAEVWANVAVEANERVAGFGINSVLLYAALALFYSLIHSLLEEYYWRWFVFERWRELFGLAVGIVVSSLGFMAHHVIVLAYYFGWDSPTTYIFSALIAVGGAVWAAIYYRDGTLWGVWLSHLLIDAMIFFIGYDLIWG